MVSKISVIRHPEVECNGSGKFSDNDLAADKILLQQAAVCGG